MSRSHSIQAKRLTEAVIIAESTAEISSTEKDINKLADRLTDLSKEGKTAEARLSDDGGVIMFSRSLGKSGGYEYTVRLERSSQSSGAGDYCEDRISVYSSDETGASDALPEPLYTLKSGKYFGEDR